MERLPDALLTHFAAYAPLSAGAQAAIAGISKSFTLGKNEVLQPAGHTCKTIYFIIKGIARIHYLKDGLDITEHFAFGPAIVIRAESLFKNQASRKSIEVVETADLVAIDAAGLFRLYDQFPEIERLFRRIFEDCYVETIHRLESIQFHSAKERYADLLREQPEILRRVPLKYIASYLGITQVTLSRIRAGIK